MDYFDRTYKTFSEILENPSVRVESFAAVEEVDRLAFDSHLGARRVVPQVDVT